MKLKITCIALFLIVFIANAQQNLESIDFNGQTFYLIGDDWNLFDEHEQSFTPIKKNEVSVLFKSGITPTQIEAFTENYQLNFMRKAETGWHDFMFDSSHDVLAKCDTLQSNAIVQVVEIAAHFSFHVMPNDSAFSQFNGGTGTIYQFNLTNSGVDDAWNITTGL